jgi:hypothetical protein
MQYPMFQQKKWRFTEQEDKKLIDLIGKYSEFQWEEIKKQFPNRSLRQLKDRWRLYLDPRIKKSSWTPEEDLLLLNGQFEFGNSWKSISNYYLPNRSESAIRNRYQQLKNLIIKHQKKHDVFNFVFDGFEMKFLNIEEGGFFAL